jgi:hypothetical protein
VRASGIIALNWWGPTREAFKIMEEKVDPHLIGPISLHANNNAQIGFIDFGGRKLAPTCKDVFWGPNPA